METTARKVFENSTDAIAAQRAESFIDGQAHGAGTWRDLTDVPIQGVVSGAILRITDKVGTDRGGPMRHIELRRGDRVIVTFVYSHFTRRLVRTF